MQFLGQIGVFRDGARPSLLPHVDMMGLALMGGGLAATVCGG